MFHREGKRILLTTFGKSVLPHLQQIADEAEAAKTLDQNFRLLDQVPVRLGVLNTVGHVRLARFLSDFKRQNKGLELSVSEGSMATLSDRLDHGEIDIAILARTEYTANRFNLRDLQEERYVVVCPPDHRLDRMNAIRLNELSGEDYVDRLACEMREMVMTVCSAEGIELYARFRSDREDWVQAMVLAGIGFAFMPEYSVSLPGLIHRPLIEPEVTRTVTAATMPGRPHSPAIAALMRATQKFAWPG